MRHRKGGDNIEKKELTGTEGARLDSPTCFAVKEKEKKRKVKTILGLKKGKKLRAGGKEERKMGSFKRKT